MQILPWRRNALTALEWTLLLPVIPLLVYHRKLHRVVCVVQATAFAWLLVLLLVPDSGATVPWWALCAVMLGCWLFHAVALQFKQPTGKIMVAVRLLGYISAVNFVTCLPLHYKHTEHRMLLRVCRFVVHTGVCVAVVLLLVYYFTFLPTYEAWGCYPPGVSLSNHNLGMCGTMPLNPGPGWWQERSTKESMVCILHYSYNGPNCAAPISAARAYGAPLAYGHNALLAAVAAYVLAAAFAWEAALDGAN